MGGTGSVWGGIKQSEMWPGPGEVGVGAQVSSRHQAQVCAHRCVGGKGRSATRGGNCRQLQVLEYLIKVGGGA